MTPAGSTQGARRVGALAVVVSAGASPFLAQTLTAVASQTCAPDVVLVVDVASRVNGLGDGTPIEELVGEIEDEFDGPAEPAPAAPTADPQEEPEDDRDR